MSNEDLAQRLWHARQTGKVIDAASVTTPATVADAYAVHWRIAALSDHKVVGFKIGSTSLEAQRMLGTDEPGSAPLLAPYVHASPATIPVVMSQVPCVEGEFAFRLGRDLPARAAAYTREEIAAAVDAVAGAIEVVGTRFAGGLAGKGRLLTTADGGVNIALVTGTWMTGWRSLDLPSHRVAMRIGGELKGEGPGSRALGDPMTVLEWRVNQQSRTGRGMKAGEIASTGTCTGLDPVAPGERAVADFGALGSVEIAFVSFKS